VTEADTTPLRADPAGLGPGEALTQAREEFDIPIEEMARRLRLSVATVRALEECDRASLPETAYVLGYVRAYVRMLDLDPDPYVAAYRAWLRRDAEEVPSQPEDTEPAPRRSHRPLGWIALAVAAGIAAVVLWWWQTRAPLDGARAPVVTSTLEEGGGRGESPAGPGAMPSSDRAQEAEGMGMAGGSSLPQHPAPTPEPPEKPAQDGSPAPPDSDAGMAQEAGTAVPTAGPRRHEPDARPAVESSTAAAAPVPAEGTHQLTLRFKARSWTEVYDADGRRLLFDLYKPGQVKVVQGRPPFKIRLGFADGVELLYDGEPVDMRRYVRPDKTARFTLGEPGAPGASP